MAKWNPVVIKTPENIKPDFEFDLKGEVCPYTFVKSKLALEMLDSGQILQVTVDNDESATNVPGPPHRKVNSCHDFTPVVTSTILCGV